MLVLQILGKKWSLKRGWIFRAKHWTFLLGLWETIIWTAWISNQHMKSGHFKPTCFPWAIRTATCTHLDLQGSVFSAEQCSRNPSAAQCPGTAPQHSLPWWTGLSFTDWELMDVWLSNFTGSQDCRVWNPPAKADSLQWVPKTEQF